MMARLPWWTLSFGLAPALMPSGLVAQRGAEAVGPVYQELFEARGDRLEDGNHLRVRLGLGRSDPMVALSHGERARDAFEAAGYEVALDLFDGGHEVPDDALERAVAWLRGQVNRR